MIERYENRARLLENERTLMVSPPLIWVERAFKGAKEAATWSKDPDRQVGAVVMNQKKRMFQGFNGFPQHILDHPALLTNREIKRSLMIHAEINAMQCAGPENVEDGVLFVTAPTCHVCAAEIVNRGIIAVHCLKAPDETWDHYGESFRLAKQTYALAGVYYKEHDDQNY